MKLVAVVLGIGIALLVTVLFLVIGLPQINQRTRDRRMTETEEKVVSDIAETDQAIKRMMTGTYRAYILPTIAPTLTSKAAIAKARARRTTNARSTKAKRQLRTRYVQATATRGAFEDKIVGLCARADTTCRVVNGNQLDVVAPDYVKKEICAVARCT